MFDIGFLELMLIGIVGLLVLGPERLPKAARTTGLWIGKIKRSVSGMQREISAQLDAEELRQKLAEQQKKLDAGFDKARRDVESYAESSPGEEDKTPPPSGSVSRTDESVGKRAEKTDSATPTQPATSQQAEHEPIEPSTPATDANAANVADDSSSDTADATSVDKDSAPR